MRGIILATKGYISPGCTVIKRYVLPLQLQIQEPKLLDLSIVDKSQLNLDITLIDKNVNLKITKENINVKKSDSTDINIDI